MSSTDPNWQRLHERYPPQLPPDYLNLDDDVKKLTGYWQPIANQGYVGRCTAEAFSESTKMRFACLGELLAPSSEWLYGKARTRLISPNNGPPGTGIGDVALVARLGFVPRAKYPDADLRFDRVDLALAWEKKGPPAGLDKEARRKSLAYIVLNKEEIFTALCLKMPVVFNADWYFTMTDFKGGIIGTSIARPLSHAMTIQGLIKIDGKLHFCIRNQMGTKIFTGKNHPRFPMRGTGILPVAEFSNLGVMFAVAGDRG